MKYQARVLIVSAITIISIGTSSYAFAATTTPTPDYVTNGTGQIHNRLEALNTFIALYTKDKIYFNTQQQRQIESQYTSLQEIFTTLQAKMKTDTGSNLVSDYNAIDTGVYFYEEKLPLLYSELFFFKAIYLAGKFSTISTNLVPEIMAIIPTANKEQASTLSDDMLKISADASEQILSINMSYSQLSDAQTEKDPIAAFKPVLTSIKTHQESLLADMKLLNTDFSTILSLY